MPRSTRGSRDMQPAEAHASVFIVPELHEGAAAEVTLQEHPFPPYLPSRMHYVAYIKEDDLLLPLLGALILCFMLEKKITTPKWSIAPQ